MTKIRKRRRWLRWLGAVLGVLVVAAGVLAWRLMRVEAVRLDGAVHVLVGGGGNTLVLASDDGALVVDTKMGPPGRKTAELVAGLTGKPVKMVINTHYHGDHTHGNPRYPGAEVVGQRRTREHMLSRDAGFFGPGGDGAGTEVKTLVDESKRFRFGDEEVEVRWPGRGHTDGDVVVFLRKRSVLHTGDLFVNGSYPVIDGPGGGSVRELAATLEKVRAMGAATIVPGHGAIAGPAELGSYAEYVRALWEHVLGAARAGRPAEQACEGFDAERFRLSGIPGLSSLAKNCATAFEEARAAVAAERR